MDLLLVISPAEAGPALLQPSAPAYRPTHEQGEIVPGIRTLLQQQLRAGLEQSPLLLLPPKILFTPTNRATKHLPCASLQLHVWN